MINKSNFALMFEEIDTIKEELYVDIGFLRFCQSKIMSLFGLAITNNGT